jgi:hypothetical protein
MNSRWKFETFQFGKCSITRWKDNLRRLASDTTLTALSLMYTAPGDDLKRELGGALADNSTLRGESGYRLSITFLAFVRTCGHGSGYTYVRTSPGCLPVV